MTPSSPPTLVGVGPVLVDQFVHCDELPTGPDLPPPGSKLQATDADHMTRVRRKWVEGWSYVAQVGGPVYIALRQAARLGAHVDFVGAVGSDDLGETITADLVRNGFRHDRIVTQEGRRSGSAIVWIDRHGERSILFDSGSLDPLEPEDLNGLNNLSYDGVHIDSREPRAALALALQARERNKYVHYDIDPWNEHSNELLRATSVAQVALSDFHQRENGPTLETARRLQTDHDLDLAIITLGPAGACAAGRNNEFYSVPGYPAIDANTTGAGDAFAGAFSYFTLTENNTTRCLQAANAAGAFMASRIDNLEVATLDGIYKTIGLE